VVMTFLPAFIHCDTTTSDFMKAGKPHSIPPRR
jgi:hypothetical protein